MSKKKKQKTTEEPKGGNASSKREVTDDDKEEKRPPAYDPNGSLGIARGLTRKEASEERAKLESLAEKTPGYRRHLTSDLAEERRKALQADDLAPVLTRLTPQQKLGLKRRRKQDKVVTAKMERLETKRLAAAVAAAQAESILQTAETGLLEAEHDMERTTAVTQVELKRNHLDEEMAQNIFDLTLADSGPYGLEYDGSGRRAVLHGQTGGHLAVLDCLNRSLVTEFYVHERIRDACFLADSLVAAAQYNHVYIYDEAGTEIHKLEDHTDPAALQYLPHHLLLASIGRAGYLKYQDISTGELVSTHRTGLGACHVLRRNPSNAVLHAGHANGTVTLWSPASSKPLVKMLCHKGAAVTSLAVDLQGRTMVTGGADRQVRVWDLRTYQQRHSYYVPAGIPTSLDISHTGLLGIGHAGHATIWNAEAMQQKVKDPYMHHGLPGKGPVETLRFCPFQDVCGIGHAVGISSIVIPGAGEATVDSTEYDLYTDKKQRREQQVRTLMDKLRPEMIGLDPGVIGGVEESDPHKRLERLHDLEEDANARGRPAKKQKSKKRGRSKIQTKLRRKHRNILDQNTLKLKEAREKEKAIHAATASGTEPTTPKEEAPSALKRFY